jgi:hypothetical protein
MQDNGTRRVVLTGGPGGGKTTAADLFRREIGDHVVVVPEAATLLFSGGFPRLDEPESARAAQRAIYHVQRNLEDVYARHYPCRVLLCDRGTLDGASYWPDESPQGFFEAMATSLEHELTRYDAVLFFETAAVGDCRIEGGNRVRTESNAQAVQLDGALRKVWSRHPRFTLVPHMPSFFDKLTVALRALHAVLGTSARTAGDC